MKGKPKGAWGWAHRPQALALVLSVLVLAAIVAPSSLQPEQRTDGAHPPKVLNSFSRRGPAMAGEAVKAPEPPQRVDCSLQRCLALTFDDGPDRDYTPRILDTLQRWHVRATFFVIGPHAERHPDLVQREYREGHEVGNHSWSHHDFTTLTPAQMQQEVSHTQQVITASGVPAPTLFRPPYGAVDERVLANVPLSVVRWNIDPEDWKARRFEPIVENSLLYMKPGGVIVLHDTEQYTAEALEPLLQQLAGHYEFVTVSELLNLPPGQRGQFFGR